MVWLGSGGILLGLWSAQYIDRISVWFYVVSLILLPVIRFRKFISVIGLLLCTFTLGVFRSQAWLSSHRAADRLIGQKVVVEGRVITDSIYDDRRQTEIEIDQVTIYIKDNTIKPKGKIRIRGFGAPLVLRHDIIRATGKLNSGFGTRIASMSFTSIEVLARSGSKLEEFRRSFSANLFSQLSDQDASLALGILVGQRSSITDQNQNNLRAAGLTHIIAVSGYNLSVLVRLVRRRLGRLSKFQAMVISVTLITLFIMIAGASASIVRAAWVIGLSLAAWYVGRTIRPIVLLMLSAAGSVWFNPDFIWYDIGWWLSFAAFFGVLMIGPQLQTRIFKNKKPNFLIQVAIESLAASLMTMPLIMWVFTRVSLVSLLANILVVPLIPIIMVLSFGAGIMIFISSKFLLTKLITAITGLLLSYILSISAWLASIPYSELIVSINTAQLLTIYLIIIVATWVLHQKTSLIKPYDLLE